MKKIRFTLPTYITLFIFLCIQLSAQEICNNGIDDDNDGLIDYIDRECENYSPCEEVIACNSTLYQIISNVLKRYDPTTSTYVDIGPSSIGAFNGAGYNVEDGYVYAIKSISGSPHMLKVNGLVAAEDLGEITNWSDITYSADVDINGNWTAFTGETSPSLRTIDVDQLIKIHI